jgi:hypothetical protein
MKPVHVKVFSETNHISANFGHFDKKKIQIPVMLEVKI